MEAKSMGIRIGRITMVVKFACRHCRALHKAEPEGLIIKDRMIVLIQIIIRKMRIALSNRNVLMPRQFLGQL